jgi:ferredoxin-NADP reductase
MVLDSMETIAHQTYQLEFFSKDNLPINYAAGQFVTFVLFNADGKRIHRSYSIASPSVRENVNRLTLLIRYVPGGFFTEQMLKFQPGHELQFIGPVGKFVLAQPLADEIYFVGTGTGLAPLYSILKSTPEAFLGRKKLKLFFGNRHDEDIFYVEELKELQRSIPNLEIQYLLSKPKSNHWASTGRVTGPVCSQDFDPSRSQFYLCGNGAMIKEIQAFLFEKAMPRTSVFHEAFD